MADPVADSLLEWRKHFPALESCVHLISHSLGCVPAKAKDDLGEFIELWSTKSITAWSDWLPEVNHAAARIEKILSAPAGTVIMHQNVSTVMAVLASCFDYTGGRNKIVYEALQFPTVSYVWQAEARRTWRLGDGQMLLAGAEVAQADFDRVVGELEADLPDLFSLKATLEKKAEGAAAGPAANLFMAFCWAFMLKLAWLMPGNVFTLPLSEMSKVGIIVNCVLMVLNLLPLPPLDGGRIAVSLLPHGLAWRFAKIERWGFPILLLLLFTGILGAVMNPLVIFAARTIESIFGLY